MPKSLFFSAAMAIISAVPRPLFAQVKPASAQAITTAVTRKMANKSMSAKFCQLYADKITGPRPHECGRVWVVPDGRMRFTYDSAGKEFVFDGKAAYFAEPEAGQVTLLEGFAGTPLADALAWVWGGKALDKGPFDVALCSAKDCPKIKLYEQVLRLLPKKEVQGVARVDVIVDTKTNEVASSIVQDLLGNTTTYTLTQRKIGQQISDDRFVYHVPQGLSLLRAGE